MKGGVRNQIFFLLLLTSLSSCTAGLLILYFIFALPFSSAGDPKRLTPSSPSPLYPPDSPVRLVRPRVRDWPQSHPTRLADLYAPRSFARPQSITRIATLKSKSFFFFSHARGTCASNFTLGQLCAQPSEIQGTLMESPRRVVTFSRNRGANDLMLQSQQGCLTCTLPSPPSRCIPGLPEIPPADSWRKEAPQCHLPPPHLLNISVITGPVVADETRLRVRFVEGGSPLAPR